MSDYKCPRCGGKLVKSGKTPGGRQRYVCHTYSGNERVQCYKTTNPKAVEAQTQSPFRTEGPMPVFKRKLKDAKRYIITAAQDFTPVQDAFWLNLLAAKTYYKAELLVIPLRYKNPTSRFSKERLQLEADEEAWVEEVRPYLWNAKLRINSNITVMGDIKIVPTASEPLTGLEAFSGPESAIVGHTKLQMKTVATPGKKMAKILTTTGACTKPNYTDSRAGKVGEFHHTLGAVLVEIEGDKFWMRHLNADKHGSFTDLDVWVSDGKVEDAAPPLALICGDTHVDFTDLTVDEATFGKQNSIVTDLHPEAIVWHDLLDAYSCNVHHDGNPFNAIAKLKSGMNSVAREVQRAIKWATDRTPLGVQSYIISSNHDDMLRRWIINADWKEDAENAEFYLETALVMARSAKVGEGGTEYVSPFAHWVGKQGVKDVHCVGTDESLTFAGIECGFHGDRGPNGARGSIRNMRRIGSKTVIGHSHSPGINEGCYQVGTSSKLRLEYNTGPSGWLNCHALIHRDGKRQLVTIIEGRYRL
jgi:hypothetical protein